MQFESPVSTSLDELVKLRDLAQALNSSTRRRSAAPKSGGAASRRLGRGLDFAEVREYQAGDDVRMIDWNVTARTGRTHTKLFIEERERPVMLVVDCRSTMHFATRGLYKSALAARLAALVGWTAVANHDRVGGFVFTDDWHAEVRPQPGRRGLMNLFRSIVEAQLHKSGRNRSQFADSLGRLRHGVHAGSSVIILSDFYAFDRSAQSALGGVLHSLDLLAVQIADPLEYTLPVAGQYAIVGSNPSATKPIRIRTGGARQAEAYARRFSQHRQLVVDYFARGRHAHVVAATDQALQDSAYRVMHRVVDNHGLKQTE